MTYITMKCLKNDIQLCQRTLILFFVCFNGNMDKYLISLILQLTPERCLCGKQFTLCIRRPCTFIKYTFVGPIWHQEVCVIPSLLRSVLSQAVGNKNLVLGISGCSSKVMPHEPKNQKTHREIQMQQFQIGVPKRPC